MTYAMTPEAERLLAGYLDRVRSSMAAAGREDTEVESVVDALREQAWEMAAQSGGSPISDAAMQGALSELEAPETFGSTPAGSEPMPTQQIRGAIRQAGGRSSAADNGRWLGWLSAAGGLATLILSVVAGAVWEDAGGSVLILGFGVTLLAGAMSWRTLPGRFGLALSLVVLGGIGLLFLLGV